jgi:hypothetical protein
VTRDESLTCVEVILAGWPGNPWSVDQIDSYARAIEGQHFFTTRKAIESAQRSLKFRPPVAELLEFIRIQRSLSEGEQARLIEPEKVPRPEWVKRWERARAAKDARLFPEQMRGMDELARRSPEDFKVYSLPEVPITDAEYWVQIGEYEDESLPTIGVLDE